MGGKDSFIDSWDDYFAAIAGTVARKSKDSSRVGAVIVTPDKLVIATGYNGFPRHLYDDPDVLGDDIEKLVWVVHAEHNAILNAARVGACLKGCTIYVNKFPCVDCLKSIIQSGISSLYTTDDGYWKNDPQESGERGSKEAERKRKLIKSAGLQVRAPNHGSYPPSS